MLELTLIYLLAAVLGVATFRSLRLPPMLGYLAVGVLIGPNALALAGASQGVPALAEFGVVFLMFSIGLEFSLAKLLAMRRHVLGLGLAQVLGMMLLAWLASWLLARHYPMSWQDALVLGGALAMSSTAIVGKLLAERLELDTAHGRRVMGVLLFQDIAVVPLLIIIPALGRSESNADTLRVAFLALFKISIALVLLLGAGKRLIAPWLDLVARRQSTELFVLNVLLMTLGLAWLTEQAGLSLALGAFVAGMLIAETRYRTQVESDIGPFRDVLLGLFFITIGMLLDWRILLLHYWLVLLFLVALLLLKTVLVFLLARSLGAERGVALRVALWLAQAGEFSFVLLNLARRHDLIEPELFNPVLAAMVLSMLLMPFLAMRIEAIVGRLAVGEWMGQSLTITKLASRSLRSQGHVLICGFGRCGQNLAQLLKREGLPYVALDLDPERVRQAEAAGHTVLYGDATKPQILQAAGLARARALVVTHADLPSTLKVLRLARSLAPALPLLARARDEGEIEAMRSAGATEVVAEIIEGSLMLAAHALALAGVPMRRVLRDVQNARESRYAMLRGYFHGADDSGVDADLEQLRSITLEPTSDALGRTLEQLQLTTVALISLRRRGRDVEQAEQATLQAGDVLVLRGLPGALQAAEQTLLRG